MTTGTFIIETYENGSIVDEGEETDLLTITVGTISNDLSAESDSTVTYEPAEITLNMSPSNLIPVDGILEIVIPTTDIEVNNQASLTNSGTISLGSSSTTFTSISYTSGTLTITDAFPIEYDPTDPT